MGTRGGCLTCIMDSAWTIPRGGVGGFSRAYWNLLLEDFVPEFAAIDGGTIDSEAARGGVFVKESCRIH